MKSINENETGGPNLDGSISNFRENGSRKKFSERIKNLPSWIIVTLIALIFLVLFCVIPLIIIEVSNQWCALFSGFFNAITPGICP
jgi:hypothetical protein